jgi:hypothetical protein
MSAIPADPRAHTDPLIPAAWGFPWIKAQTPSFTSTCIGHRTVHIPQTLYTFLVVMTLLSSGHRVPNPAVFPADDSAADALSLCGLTAGLRLADFLGL